MSFSCVQPHSLALPPEFCAMHAIISTSEWLTGVVMIFRYDNISQHLPLSVIESDFGDSNRIYRACELVLSRKLWRYVIVGGKVGEGKIIKEPFARLKTYLHLLKGKLLVETAAAQDLRDVDHWVKSLSILFDGGTVVDCFIGSTKFPPGQGWKTNHSLHWDWLLQSWRQLRIMQWKTASGDPCACAHQHYPHPTLLFHILNRPN